MVTRTSRTVILGGTRGIGRALARRLSARGDRLFLLGRDETDLKTSAADLELRAGGGPSIGFAICDLDRPETFEPALAEADRVLGGFDTVIVTAAMFATQDTLDADPALAHRLLVVDFANTIAFCEHARRRLLDRGGGTLCVFSSVSGERGRQPIVLYGAAKAGLTRYLEGLDHRFRRAGLVTVCVKPGFVRTSMTAGVRPPPFAGEPDPVAARVVAAIDRGQPVVYAPPIWALVMLVIRNLPRAVMRRLRF